MTVIGGSKRYNMLPDTFIKKKYKAKHPSEKHALCHTLPE